MSIGDLRLGDYTKPRRNERQIKVEGSRVGFVWLMVALVLTIVASVVIVQTTTHLPGKLTEVVVLPGQTLWGIAREHAGPGHDVRDLVYRIREVNGLEDATIFPGQVLRIPTMKS